MHLMHSGGVHTLMLAVFNLVKMLISTNMYSNRSTSVAHQPMNEKVLVSVQETKLWHEVYALAHAFVTVSC